MAVHRHSALRHKLVSTSTSSEGLRTRSSVWAWRFVRFRMRRSRQACGCTRRFIRFIRFKSAVRRRSAAVRGCATFEVVAFDGISNGLHWVGGNGYKPQSVAPWGYRCLVRVACLIKGALVAHSLWCQVSGFSSGIGHRGVLSAGEFLSGDDTVGHGMNGLVSKGVRPMYKRRKSNRGVLLAPS